MTTSFEHFIDNHNLQVTITRESVIYGSQWCAILDGLWRIVDYPLGVGVYRGWGATPDIALSQLAELLSGQTIVLDRVTIKCDYEWMEED